MRTGIIGTKIGNTSFFNEDGSVSPVTLVKIEECVVSGVKTKDKDGYFAIQLASIDNKSKNPKIKKPQKKIFASLNIKPKKIVKEFRVIEENLYTSHLPQPSADMILRTSGEKRMSGFLMWQSAYSELVFLDVFWPEFRKIDLMRAIRTFQKRKRRVGK